MTYDTLILSALFIAAMTCVSWAAREPIQLHPQNPHYFLFRGKPTILITSGEHYGAVLNLDFDYVKYLDTLAADGLNHTRMFVGSYVEQDNAFRIARNTLAPLPGRFICPWARSNQPGYANGGNKFDLSKWDASYFKRLKDFIGQASRRGIVVEVNLFCPFYHEEMWRLSPMNAINNVNGIGKVGRSRVYTLNNHGGLLSVQEAMVRKIVRELRDFDNIYYEIMNEPYACRVPRKWEYHIADVITEAEKKFQHKHLISQNVANRKAKVRAPHPAISIFNFHYAQPPDTVAMNYGLNKVIGDNETGFRGTVATPYRIEGWDFIVAGGGLYNNLDYSFTAGHEDGTFRFPKTQPGSGGPTLRRQLKILKDFIYSFDFIHMTPNDSVIKSKLPEGVSVQTLVEVGKQYAIYLHRPTDKPERTKVTLGIALPGGKYRFDWMNPKTGKVGKPKTFMHGGGARNIPIPVFREDVALRIVKVD